MMSQNNITTFIAVLAVIVINSSRPYFYLSSLQEFFFPGQGQRVQSHGSTRDAKEREKYKIRIPNWDLSSHTPTDANLLNDNKKILRINAVCLVRDNSHHIAFTHCTLMQ